MRSRGKKYTAARAQVAPDRTYSIEEAVPLVQKVKYAKFDETVELTLRLGVDPDLGEEILDHLNVMFRLVQVLLPLLAKIWVHDALERGLVDLNASELGFQGLQQQLFDLFVHGMFL